MGSPLPAISPFPYNIQAKKPLIRSFSVDILIIAAATEVLLSTFRFQQSKRLF
jgi:hypothetical protein